MIYALDGPDCCGKSTVFQALRDIRCSSCRPRYPCPQGGLCRRALIDRIAFVPSFPEGYECERTNSGLWEALYDPKRLYVSDRHFSITGAVYSKLYGRPFRDHKRWRSEVVPVYFDVPVEELRRRHAVRGDADFDAELYSDCVDAYMDVLRTFPRWHRVNGTLPVEAICAKIMAFLDSGMR